MPVPDINNRKRFPLPIPTPVRSSSPSIINKSSPPSSDGGDILLVETRRIKLLTNLLRKFHRGRCPLLAGLATLSPPKMNSDAETATGISNRKRFPLPIPTPVRSSFLSMTNNNTHHQKMAGIVIGGDKEDRTPDLLTASQTLSQLSYAPVAVHMKSTN